MFRISLLVSLSVCWWCVRGGEVTNACVNVLIPEEDLKFLRKISTNLDTFLQRNLEKGLQSLKKVLTAYDTDIDPLFKMDSEAPLQSFLLQHQIMMHRQMKTMFLEMQNLLQLTSSTFNRSWENEVHIPNPKLKPGIKSKIHKEKINLSVKPFADWNTSLSLLEVKGVYRSTDFKLRPSDCSELLVAGEKKSGVYQIYPFGCKCSSPVKVFCDMDTDGGGWTVIAARMNQSKPLNFTRNWWEYKKGFGSADAEYWLGNEVLHILTTSRNYVMRMEAKDGYGRNIWGEWNTFKVNSEETKYKLTVQRYNAKSIAADMLFSYHNENAFSTFDQDNDKGKTKCAEKYKGGWWYNECHHIHATGIHGKKGDDGLHIHPWSKMDSTTRYADWLQIKLRPEICSDVISLVKLNTHNCDFN